MRGNSLLECLKNDPWYNKHTGYHNDGPTFGDIVTHNGDSDSRHIYLQEYPLCVCGCGSRRAFAKKWFREVQPPMTIDISELQHQPQTV